MNGAARAAPVGVPAHAHGRLFRRYFILILALVTSALVVSSAISLYFSYRETLAALYSLQREKALAASDRIRTYVENIQSQLRGATLPQLGAEGGELRRIEFLKLLKQVPDVTDLGFIGPDGCEKAQVSRLTMDALGECLADRSRDPVFTAPTPSQPWYGPVTFRKETEPYMTIAVRSGGPKGPVTWADVNLKFMWDVISRIKVGDSGKAFVVDRTGHLIADPDIGLVLRKSDLSSLTHVATALAGSADDALAVVTTDLAGRRVLAAHAPIEPLGWTVFVEQPVAEVTARLNEFVMRTLALIAGGILFSALAALFLARGMARPIGVLQQSAQRIGAGELDHRIELKTGDELEALAGQFNNMTAQLRESYAGLERKVDERTRELTHSLEQQTAISEILRVISSSPTDVKPVLDVVAERAALLCDATYARVLLVEGEKLDPVAGYQDGTQASAELLAGTVAVPLDRTSLTGRAAVDLATIHHDDVVPLLADAYPGARANMERFGLRAVLVVPLMREGGAYGGIILARTKPGFFRPDQVALVETFARQSAIAIDNVRLFNETKEALDQQTAISEILRVISGSPGDVRPMLDAVAERALVLCEAAQATIMLVDGGSLRCAASKGATQHMQPGETMPLTRGSVAGRAVLDRVSFQIDNLEAASEDDFPVARDLQRRIGHHTAMAVPLMREGRAIGAIQLWRMEVRPFTEQKIALVKTFADQAAIAIENVRLFNETKEALEQQRASAEVLAAISSSIADTGPVFEKIVSSCEALFAGKVAVIDVLHEDGRVYLGAYHGPNRDQVQDLYPHSASEASATGTAMARREIVQFSSLAEAPGFGREAFERFGIQAAIGAPMIWEGRGIGAIWVGREQAGPFSAKETSLLRTFASQAVIAIQNARLVNETREALERQTATAEVLQVISSSVADTEPVFDKILASGSRLFATEQMGIFLARADGMVEAAAFRGSALAAIAATFPKPLEASITGQVVREGRLIQVEDAAAMQDAPTTVRDVLPLIGNFSGAWAPMAWEGQAIGSIGVLRQPPSPLNGKEIELLKTFADQAVIAIQNARLFREIADKSRQLEVANKHKSEFLANMSHELRTPLNAIIGFSEVLLERMFGDLNEKQDDYLKDIHSSGKHLLSLINDILDLSKVEAGRMELETSRFRVPEAVGNAMTLIRERAQRHGIALGTTIGDDVEEVTADERKFKQILLNLLTNAVKFTPDGGRVDVFARSVPAGLEVAVRDTGIGISAEDQKLVFEEFRQVGRNYTNKQEGTGLGLALTRRFVELHGGTIRLESEPGKGSTFTFTIPAMPATAGSEAA